MALPGGMTPGQAGMAAMVSLFVLPRMLGIGMMPILLVGGVGGFVWHSSRDGQGARGVLLAGRKAVGKLGQSIGSATGRPVSDAQAAFLLVVGIALVYRYVLSSGPSSSSSASSGLGGGMFGGGASSANDDLFPAYTKGYEDGKAGKAFRPTNDPVSEGKASKSGGFGIGSLFSLMMVGGMLMQMAGSPPSVENLMMNARNMGPMQIMILFNMVSGLFS